MKNLLITLLLISMAFASQAQMYQMQKLDRSESGSVSLGAYAQIDYNQPLDPDFKKNGKLDVHRLVMTMGYKFNDRTKFFSEIEFEHVKEVYIEQAFISYKLTDYMNLKAGLVLIPMGIINERHEPNIYNGVERPNLDKYIVPTTWREIGAGIAGRVDDASIKYQLYLVNGFNGYNGEAKLGGTNGFRKGRQKGAESFASAPNVSAKIDYYGFGNLKFGLAAYMGKTQSSMYNGLDRNDAAAMATADSTVVGLNMFGLDCQYTRGGLQARGQYIIANVTNSESYNAFTGSDLGSMLTGYYAEVGFDVLNGRDGDAGLIPFVRYENYNTHAKTAESLPVNDALNRTDITFGIGWKLSSGAILKGDYQILDSKAADSPKYQLNFGVGVSF